MLETVVTHGAVECVHFQFCVCIETWYSKNLDVNGAAVMVLLNDVGLGTVIFCSYHNF